MQWRRDLWLLVLAVGAGLFVVGERTLTATEDPAFLPLLILIGAATGPAAFTALSRGWGLRYTTPFWTLGGAAVLAGLLGSTIAGLLTYGTLRSLGPVSLVLVATIVESAKLLVPLAVLAVRPGRRAADGLLVGVVAGASFAAAEAGSYLLLALAGTSAGGHDLLVRGLLGPAAQLAWTGLTATTLWMAAQQSWSGRSLRRFVLALAGVVALHATWESADGLLLRIALTLFSAVLIGGVARRVGPVRRPAPPTPAPTPAPTPG